MFQIFADWVTFVVTFFCILETYKYYDGIIWPEILDEKAASEHWIIAKAKSWFSWRSKSSSATQNKDSTNSHGGTATPSEDSTNLHGGTATPSEDSTNSHEGTATSSEDSTNSHEGNIKRFSDQDHTEFRKFALNLYLCDFLKDFTTATSENDQVEIVRMVYAVYTSVSSSYLYYDNDEHIWNPSYKDTAEVIK